MNSGQEQETATHTTTTDNQQAQRFTQTN